jgi:uncharacterized repeat protein (TIGR03803 family)
VFLAATAIASPAQTLRTLLSFDGINGVEPLMRLVQGADGNLYGTTESGGANGEGTIFKISERGGLTTLYSFCPQVGCIDGSSPQAGLIQATNGDFYGTTALGGTNDEGTIFRITAAGTLTTLYSFCSLPACRDGAVLVAGLVQGSNGDLYGTTNQGGFSQSWHSVQNHSRRQVLSPLQLLRSNKLCGWLLPCSESNPI